MRVLLLALLAAISYAQTVPRRELYLVPLHKDAVTQAISRKKLNLEENIIRAMEDGAAEPDEETCPYAFGSEMYVQTAQQVLPTAEYGGNYGIGGCRILIQIWHGSPLAMVTAEDVNTSLEDGNYDWPFDGEQFTDKKYYSLITNRQWRRKLIETMSTAFLYAISVDSGSKGAKQLGYMFHTLADTFAASHIVRAEGGSDCESKVIKLAVGMDVTFWMAHLGADTVEDDLFECSIEWISKAIEIWKDAREASDKTDVSHIKDSLRTVINDVLCPATKFEDGIENYPAGGATKDFSTAQYFDMSESLSSKTSAFTGSKHIFPAGLVPEEEAKKIFDSYENLVNEERRSSTDNSNYPFRFSYPARDALDICSNQGLEQWLDTLVSANRVQNIIAKILPLDSYFQPDYEVGQCTDDVIVGSCMIGACSESRGHAYCDADSDCRCDPGFQSNGAWFNEKCVPCSGTVRQEVEHAKQENSVATSIFALTKRKQGSTKKDISFLNYKQLIMALACVGAFSTIVYAYACLMNVGKYTEIKSGVSEQEI